MTSQGVFGFINQLRVQITLEFTHDEKLWVPLDFKHIPGSPERRPSLMSPYHSRLDWETWIRTTASFEHLVGQYGQEQSGDLMNHNVPDFLENLIRRVLAGDEAAARLMATRLGPIYYPNENRVGRTSSSRGGAEKVLPRAIRTKFWLYEFAGGAVPSLRKMGLEWMATGVSQIDSLVAWTAHAGRNLNREAWWKRELLGSEQGRVYRLEEMGDVEQPYADSHPCRHWVMAICLMLAALCCGEMLGSEESDDVGGEEVVEEGQGRDVPDKLETALEYPNDAPGAQTPKTNGGVVTNGTSKSPTKTGHNKSSGAPVVVSQSKGVVVAPTSSSTALAGRVPPRRPSSTAKLAQMAFFLTFCLCWVIFYLALFSDYPSDSKFYWSTFVDKRLRLASKRSLKEFRKFAAKSGFYYLYDFLPGDAPFYPDNVAALWGTFGADFLAFVDGQVLPNWKLIVQNLTLSLCCVQMAVFAIRGVASIFGERKRGVFGSLWILLTTLLLGYLGLMLNLSHAQASGGWFETGIFAGGALKLEL